MDDKAQMTNLEIAEQYEILSGHPYLPLRYREEPQPIPGWMLGLFFLMGATVIVMILGV